MNRDLISKYLDGSRIGRRDQPSQDLRTIYQLVVTICRKELEVYVGTRANVLGVYTLNRTSEIIEIGGEFYLIYDQSVGDIIDIFVRVLRWSNDNAISERVLGELMSEEGMRAGDITAVAFGMSHSIRSHDALGKLPEVGDHPDARVDVYLQQFFMFLHEYCHMMMLLDPKFADWRTKSAEHLMKIAADTTNIEQQYKSYRNDPRHTDSFEEFTANRWAQINLYCPYKRPLCQELACDEFALVVLSVICAGEGIDPKLAFLAATMSVRNIQTINHIKQTIRPSEAGKDISQQTPMLLIAARKYILRKSFRWIAQWKKMTPEKAHEMVQEINHISDVYSDKIDIPLRDSIVPAYQNAFKHRAIRDELLSIRNAQHLSQALGWQRSGEKIPYVVFD